MTRLRSRIRIIKVGGSLFGFNLAKQRLLTWLENQDSATNLLIAGGGITVDAVRTLQEQSGMSDEAAHWMAIEMLDVTAHILADWCPEFELIGGLEVVTAAKLETNIKSEYILAPWDWLRKNSTLPAQWDATSDSIAAEIAQAFKPDFDHVELVLLKSRLLQPSLNATYCKPIQAIRRLGLVDSCFERTSRGLDTLRIVNLRHDQFESIALSTT